MTEFIRHGPYIVLTNQEYLNLINGYLQAKEQNHFNPVTNLPNETGFRYFWETNATRFRREGIDPEMAVIYGDLRQFKDVNTNFGYKIGDEVLKAVAQRLKETTRPGEFIGNPHGDEFVAVIFGGKKEASVVCRRFGETLAETELEKHDLQGLKKTISPKINLKYIIAKAHDNPNKVLEIIDKEHFTKPRK